MKFCHKSGWFFTWMGSNREVGSIRMLIEVIFFDSIHIYIYTEKDISWLQGADHSRCFRLLSYLLWAFPWLSHCAPPLSATPGSPQAWALPWKLIGGLRFFAFWVRPPWFGSFLVDWCCTDSRAPGRHALRHANSVVPRFLVRSSCPFAASPPTCMSHVNHHPRRDFYFW